MNLWLPLEVLLSTAALGACAYEIYKTVDRIRNFQPLDYKVFFFTDKGIRNVNEGKVITVDTFTRPICEFLDSARHDLVVCFYVISAYNIVESIIKAKERGINVIVIVDYYFGFVNSQYTKQFIRQGVPVYSKKFDHNSSIMHCKFCIRDNKEVLFGSMNITQSALKGSFENAIISSNKTTVKHFMNLYDMLMSEFYLLNSEDEQMEAEI